VTLNDALLELVRANKVEPKEAYIKAVDKSGFENLLRRNNFDVGFLGGASGIAQ
jgi:twitching motility protein PilT